MRDKAKQEHPNKGDTLYKDGKLYRSLVDDNTAPLSDTESWEPVRDR